MEEKVTLKIADLQTTIKNSSSPVTIEVKIQNIELSGVTEELANLLVENLQKLNG